VDVFGGSAAVLLAKPPSRKRVDVYNDINEDRVTLFRVLRDTTTATILQSQLEGTPYSRAEFNLSIEPCDEANEKARRFIIRQRMSDVGLSGF
jgi:DNA adenine methylase